jgi:CDP-diglyceride synthetase
MLKHRLILGIILIIFLSGLMLLDSYAAGGWPVNPWSTPPGFFLAVVSLLIVPVALWEMRGLLASENVLISLRITGIAATLCMLWPWLEQVGESIDDTHTKLVASAPPGDAKAAADIQRIESSPWYKIGHWFRSVKPHYLIPTILAFSLVAAVIKHSRKAKVEGAMANAGGTLLAITYLGVLPGFFLPICMTHSAWMVLVIVAVVKSADIGAYATGRLIGRHKLIPWLSPGKTVEGFFGGMIFSGIVGASLALVIKNNPGIGGQDIHWIHLTRPTVVLGGALSGILLGIVGQLGDLLESLLKRDAGVKDSGRVPGFGGVLDLLDSPLLAAPVAYWLLKIVLRPI